MEEEGGGSLSTKTRRILLTINCLIMSVGVCGGPLMMRLYFVEGGSRIWLSSWLQNGGWPLTLIPLSILYFYRRKTEGSDTKFYFITPRILVASSFIGILMGLDAYLYSWGGSKLPVSTFSLLIATQLAFTAIGAYFIVKMKFTSYSINAVILLILGAILLGVKASGDRPEGVTSKAYVVGFIVTALAAALYGIIFPCIELIYLKANQAITATLVLEIQMVMCFVSSVFCTIGMIANKDFQAIARESKQFNLGEARYYKVVIWSAIIWQCFFVGGVGVIYLYSSLMFGVIISALLPVTEVLGVVFFNEKFSVEKGFALVLALWGFVSYFYGEFKQAKELKNISQENEMASLIQIEPV